MLPATLQPGDSSLLSKPSCRFIDQREAAPPHRPLRLRLTSSTPQPTQARHGVSRPPRRSRHEQPLCAVQAGAARWDDVAPLEGWYTCSPRIGESAVGKSSIVLRFVKVRITGNNQLPNILANVVQDQFDSYRESTIGAAFLTQTISLDENTTVKFEIWDTAGQERYKSLAPMYYRNANCAVVVYDITQAVRSMSPSPPLSLHPWPPTPTPPTNRASNRGRHHSTRPSPGSRSCSGRPTRTSSSRWRATSWTW